MGKLYALYNPLAANFCGNEQDVPVSFSQPSQYVTYAKGVNVPMANPYEEKSRLCGFAMLIRREAINIVEGLDEGFGLGYFEDDDISLRIRQAGYRLVVLGSFERISFSFLDTTAFIRQSYPHFFLMYS